MCHSWWALHVVINGSVLHLAYICCLSMSIYSWDITTPVFRKQTDAIWKFYFRFRFWTFYRLWHVILHPRNKLYPNWMITADKVMALCRFSKMATIWRPYRRKCTFAFWFYDVSHLGRQRTICIPNFDQISQYTADILGLLLPVALNKRPPYSNSTPGFDFDLFTVIGMWFCTGLLNFIRNRRSAMTSYWFYKMAAIASQSTSGFWFGHVWRLGRPRTIGIPNFDQISQSTAEILLLPVSINKWPPYWNSTSGFDFDLFTAIVCGFP